MSTRRLITIHGRHSERPNWSWCGRLYAHVFTHHWHLPRVELIRCKACERAALAWYRGGGSVSDAPEPVFVEGK